MPRTTQPTRGAEGPRPGAAARGKGGRPAGSRNKPKSLIPTELAEQILLAMEKQLPKEHFDYMKSVIKDGKAISTKQELDALILLLSRNLYPALIAETLPKTVETEDGEVTEGPVFRRDVTERLKVVNSLLSLRHQIDKRDEGADEDEKPILKIWADRRLDGRLGVLVGSAPALVAGDADGAGRRADEAGGVPAQVPERPLSLPSGQ